MATFGARHSGGRYGNPGLQAAPSSMRSMLRLGPQQCWQASSSVCPAVVTVRDHWPWDYFATGLHGDRLPYPRNTVASLLTDLPVRAGPGAWGAGTAGRTVHAASRAAAWTTAGTS